MKTYELTIVSEADEEHVLGTLRDWEQKQIIQFTNTDSPIFPGKPYTVEELDKLIEDAQKGPFYTVEEAKSYLGL